MRELVNFNQLLKKNKEFQVNLLNKVKNHYHWNKLSLINKKYIMIGKLK